MSGLVQIGGTGVRRVGGEVRGLRLRERLALAAVGLGAALFVVALARPDAGQAPWLGSLVFGLVGLGGVGYYLSAYGGTTPGIKNHGTFHRPLVNRGALGWVVGVALTAFYVALYWFGDSLRGVTRLLDPWSRALRGVDADQWFLYGSLYTLAVLVMGTRMLLRYRHNRYQQLRTTSVMSFQLVFAFILPGLLKRFANNDFYFTYFWPLSPYSGYPDHFSAQAETPLELVFLWWGVVGIAVLTPILTWRYGKRWYCSWVCGCGGLAETLGDPWRHLADSSERAWRVERWMIHSVLVFVVVTTTALWLNDWLNGGLGAVAGGLKQAYGFLIGMVFSGVVGVGFYPLLGSRVWCRFGCPQAAILGLIQRFFSRFRITTNGGQCISCGNCTTHCEMGIDVRSYAQRGDDIVRASCVGCGVCAAVCPRGVLRLENGATHADRYEGADTPVAEIIKALRG